jgi:type III restriction enzyme
MTELNPDRIRRAITQRLSLRRPQEEALSILAEVTALWPAGAEPDLTALLDTVKAGYASVSEFERDFPSLCFALATGVGKTRLMGAFISYLYLTGRSKNFFVLAPNTTIYDKLVADFSRQTSPKYVFRGIAEFAQRPPIIVTGDNWQEGRGIRGSDLFGGEAIINIFNVDKINREQGRIRSFRETLGESYYDYLAGLPDLVMLMDEAHRYRAKAATKAIFDLKPMLGLEVTATPKAVGAGGQRFRNIVYEYGLGNAMADGFVKEPAVATRMDFNPRDYQPDQVEEIMLVDGIHYHEHVRTQLELYARETGRPLVHPFMLVVAQDTTHAGEIRARIQSDGFFGGRYTDRVIEVHSKQTGEESDEAMARLVSLETSGDTDIVIHVNKLKEGWDVTNLYTIVPLRASASDILTEQTLGRGLRLPYGERTGVEAVDTLTVIAHDRFDQVITAARDANSIVKEMRQYRIGEGGDVSTAKQDVVTVPTYSEAKLTGEWPTMPGVAEAPPPSLFQQPEQREVAKVALELIRDKYERQLPGGVADLVKPEVLAGITADVKRLQEDRVQPELAGLAPVPDVKAIVEAVAKEIAENTIEIPEIVVLPSREVSFWFEDFDLTGLERLKPQPISDQIIIRHLRKESQEVLARPQSGPKEAKTEDYILRHLISFAEVDYDHHADLLYKLAGQMVEHLRTYLPSETDVESVALGHGKQLAEVIFGQMKGHLRKTPAEYRAKVVRQFRALKPQPVAFSPDKLRHLSQPATPLSATPSFVFTGSRKSPYALHKFQSDTERKFAELIDSDREPTVLRWLKPGRQQFQIEFEPGRAYEPDFVIETATEKMIVEIKAANEMDNAEVLAKVRAAKQWIDHANELAAGGAGKPWRYAIVRDSSITASSSLQGLTL